MSDLVEVACQCGKVFRAKPEHAGRTGHCKACGATVHIPGGSEQANVFLTVVKDKPSVADKGVAISRAFATREESEPWFYFIINGIGWISWVFGVAILVLMVVSFISALLGNERAAEAQFDMVFKLGMLACGNGLGFLALADLLRNVWRIRVRIGRGLEPWSGSK